MDSNQKAKLERYLRNARKFLWGLLGKVKKGDTYIFLKDQGDTYEWLKEEKHYKFNNGKYDYVINQLLDDSEPDIEKRGKRGIEIIIQDIVIPAVKELYSDEELRALRQCWRSHIAPNNLFIKTYNERYISPFIDVNTQYGHVEGWGEFAGVWFEEIEPIYCQGQGNSI